MKLRSCGNASDACKLCGLQCCFSIGFVLLV